MSLRACLVFAVILALLPLGARATEPPSLDALRRFPGTVLVPAEGLRPFADVPLVRADTSEAGGPVTAPEEATYVALWDDGRLFDKRVMLGGTRGSGPFALALAAEAGQGCLPRPDYCPIPPKGGFEGEPIGEVFLSVRVRDAPAVVSRLACCNGGGWRAVWYDPPADVTYELSLPLSAAYPGSQPTAERGYGSSPENIRGAREVAAIADQLVRLD